MENSGEKTAIPIPNDSDRYANLNDVYSSDTTRICNARSPNHGGDNCHECVCVDQILKIYFLTRTVLYVT